MLHLAPSNGVLALNTMYDLTIFLRSAASAIFRIFFVDNTQCPCIILQLL